MGLLSLSKRRSSAAEVAGAVATAAEAAVPRGESQASLASHNEGSTVSTFASTIVPSSTSRDSLGSSTSVSGQTGPRRDERRDSDGRQTGGGEHADAAGSADNTQDAGRGRSSAALTGKEGEEKEGGESSTRPPLQQPQRQPPRQQLNKRSSSSAKELAHTVMLLNKDYSNVAEHYSMGKELGRGRYGVIRMCKHKQREERLACKMICKSKLASVREAEDVQREVKVMELLKGHPAVIELKATYEDQRVGGHQGRKRVNLRNI